MTPRRPTEDRVDFVRELPAVRCTPIGYLGVFFPLAAWYTLIGHYKQAVFNNGPITQLPSAAGPFAYTLY
jgi:hypothetical protein